MIVDNLEILRSAYRALQYNGVVKSQADFSRRLLLRNQSYLRSMCSRRRKPSLAVLAQLEWSLQQEIVSYKRNPHLGESYAECLNAAYSCLEDQLGRIKLHRLQRLVLVNAVAANDNSPNAPILPAASRGYRQ